VELLDRIDQQGGRDKTGVDLYSATDEAGTRGVTTRMVCGPRDSGKTTWLGRLAMSQPPVGGVISVKVFKADQLCGYDAVCLANGRRIPLLRMGETGERVGRFQAVPDAFARVAEIVVRDARSGIRTIVVDEVGKLEARSGGFAGALRTILAEDRSLELYLGVGTTNVPAIRRVFGLADAEIIRVHAPRR